MLSEMFSRIICSIIFSGIEERVAWISSLLFLKDRSDICFLSALKNFPTISWLYKDNQSGLIVTLAVLSGPIDFCLSSLSSSTKGKPSLFLTFLGLDLRCPRLLKANLTSKAQGIEGCEKHRLSMSFVWFKSAFMFKFGFKFLLVWNCKFKSLKEWSLVESYWSF